MKMTTAEFRAWKARRGYTSNDPRSIGLRQAAEDLGLPKSSVSSILTGRPVPPDVARIAAMVDLLDSVAEKMLCEVHEDDRDVIIHVKSLLSVWAPKPQRTLAESHWAWQELRIDRLCQLAAAVEAVRHTTAPVLADARREAAEMVASWGGQS